MQKDNSTIRQKVQLRRRVLQELSQPVVIETHGGAGLLYRECYSDVQEGVVFERDEVKVGRLARQRPHWAVYQADSTTALAAGVGKHLTANILDVDPYGDPWPTIAAFFGSSRPWAKTMAVVVNDGLRHRIKMGNISEVATLWPVVQRYGIDLHDIYLEVCRELMIEQAAKAGYILDRFTGYYCGRLRAMTHYAAMLTRGSVD